MTIDGTGHAITVDGNSTGSVFTVNTGVTTTISGLTIQHGTSTLGGGIHNDGTLTLTNCTLSGNSSGGTGTADGGGVFNDVHGNLTMTNCTFSSNTAVRFGSGIANYGVATVSNSTLTGNSTDHGGVISNNGTLSVINGTLSGNSGGGIDNQRGTAAVTNGTISGNSTTAGGGGIFNGGDTVTVTNSTISSNSDSNGGGGGIYNINGSTLSVINSTLSGNSTYSNGGGILNEGILSVTNSTLTGNSAAFGGGIFFNYGGGTATATNSIVSGNTAVLGGSEINGNVGGDHNLIGGNALLAPLGSYGGPTQTIPLLPGSPAIDAGDDTVCAATGTGKVNGVDQRGTARPQGAHCDIGAFESQGFSLTVTGGSGQTAFLDQPFAAPLTVTLTTAGSVSPLSGAAITFTPPGSGASATITGSPAPTNTSGAASVGATANGTAGSYSVTASAPGVASVTFSLTNSGAATLTGINPSSGSIAGGTTVTLTGIGFGTTANTQVLLDGVAIPAASVTGVTGTQITYTAPAHAAGNVTVTVKVNGTAPAGRVAYTYGTVAALPPPKPPGPSGGSPSPLPAVRRTGPTGGPAPSPLPTPRP